MTLIAGIPSPEWRDVWPIVTFFVGVAVNAWSVSYRAKADVALKAHERKITFRAEQLHAIQDAAELCVRDIEAWWATVNERILASYQTDEDMAMAKLHAAVYNAQTTGTEHRNRLIKLHSRIKDEELGSDLVQLIGFEGTSEPVLTEPTETWEPRFVVRQPREELQELYGRITRRTGELLQE